MQRVGTKKVAARKGEAEAAQEACWEGAREPAISNSTYGEERSPWEGERPMKRERGSQRVEVQI